MGNGLLCDLGQSQRQGWSESGGSSSGGTEGTLPTDFYSDNEEPGRKWWPAMSLPKRDGVQGRYYLIQKPDTNPEVLEHADQCIQELAGKKGRSALVPNDQDRKSVV